MALLKTGKPASEDANVFLAGTQRFLAWLESHGYESYDPYDIWGTRFGVFSRRVFYRSSVLGLPLIAPILFLEIVCPQWRSLAVKKRRYATADGQILLAYLNLHSLSSDPAFLEKAEILGKQILEYKVPGYSGLCWGYPFDWECCHRLYPKDTPFITSTPYVFEAFAQLFAITRNPSYAEIAQSIAQFVYADLNDSKTGPNSAAASYSPLDSSQVINASAYRAWVLFEAAALFKKSDYHERALQNLNFILENQRADGSWLYALDNAAEGFIDHFHTCFVLKNLVKLNRRLNSPAVTAAVKAGYDYYRANLFSADGLPRSFTIKPRTQIARLEMYNFAESITVGCELKDEIPAAFDFAQSLARIMLTQYQLADGHFVTRVYTGGLKHTFPYLRWPQAQMFLALSNLVRALHPADAAPAQALR